MRMLPGAFFLPNKGAFGSREVLPRTRGRMRGMMGAACRPLDHKVEGRGAVIAFRLLLTLHAPLKLLCANRVA